jgi:cell wall-associated NlpC family hydrolase
LADEPLDPRTHVIRADAAAQTLQGTVPDRKFLSPRRAMVVVPLANVMKTPDKNSEMISQYLYGELVDVYETAAGWSWCQSRNDGYVGYVEASALSDHIETGSEHVTSAFATCHSAPDPNSPTLFSLPMNARLSVETKRSVNSITMCKSSTGFWIADAAISADDAPPAAYLDILKLFLGTPYLWGGKSIWGIDCSGLVQIGLQSLGIECPRDTDLQRKHFAPHGTLPLAQAKGGDIVFMPKHVAVLIDGGGNAIHADGVDMVVRFQPLAEILSNRKLTLDDTAICRIAG